MKPRILSLILQLALLASVFGVGATNPTYDTINGVTIISGTNTFTVGRGTAALTVTTSGTLGSAAYTASSAYQPIDSDLTAIAGLATDSFGRDLLIKTSAAAIRAYIGAGTGNGNGDALTTNPLSQFAATTSAQLAGAISDETGSGASVFANSPALITPDLGTPSAIVLTNAIGTASININGTVGATTANTGAFTTLTTTGNVTLGNSTNSSTATPLTLDMGGTFANSIVSSKAKIKLYSDGTAANTYGIGVSASALNLFVKSSSTFGFYVNNALQLSISSTGAIGSATWNGAIIGTAYGGTGVDNSTGGTANQFWARPDGATGAASYRAMVAADVPTLNQSTTGSAATLTTARAINGTNFDGSAAITVTAAAGTLTGATLASGVTASSLTSFGASIALGTPATGTLTNCTFPTLNQNSTGSAASLSVSGQTGLMTVTGLASTNRIKTVRDAADTLLELGGSYTPTGTWTNLTLVTPACGTPSALVGTNVTGIPPTGVTGTAAILGANTYTALQTITQASTNSGIITSTGYSLTGSNATNMVDLAGTWNTSGVVKGFKLYITNTASGAGSALMDLGTGTSTSQFLVAIGGQVNANSAYYVGQGTNFSAYGMVIGASTGQFKSGWNLQWAASSSQAEGTKDTSLSRNAAGVVQIGTGAANASGSLSCTNGTFSGNVTIGGGTAILKHLSATATLDFGSTAAGASSDLTITVTGAALGDDVVIGVPNGSMVANSVYFGWVSATNTVSVRLLNDQLVGAIDPASGTFRCSVWQH